MNIGNRITKLRKEKHLTQEELAQKLFVTNKTISSYELSRTEPSLDLLTKISEVLECSISYLIYGENQTNNIETEVKISLSTEEFKQLEKTMEEKGKFITETNHKDTYYEPSHRKFIHKDKKITEWLRIGERGNKNIINYKNWYDVYCDEYEVEIDNVDNIKKIFNIIGLKELIKVDKQRKTYMYLDKYEVALDKVKNLGYFVEIEIKKYDKSIMEEYDQLIKIIKDLKLNLNNIDRKGYPHILLEKLHKI